MPYIEDKRRKQLAWTDCYSAQTPGELNYVITMLLQRYIKEKGESYTTYNEVMGVLQCTGLELYRRKIAEYEDEKIKENGDVY